MSTRKKNRHLRRRCEYCGKCLLVWNNELALYECRTCRAPQYSNYGYDGEV